MPNIQALNAIATIKRFGLGHLRLDIFAVACYVVGYDFHHLPHIVVGY